MQKRSWNVAITRGIVIVVAVGAAAGFWITRSPADRPAPLAQVAASPAPVSQWRRAPVGRWLRSDGTYVLTIKSIGEDGLMDAVYNNPRPIHVSRAQAGIKAGKPTVFVELRDRNYPGNFYELTYNEANDQLMGQYHHLGLGQIIEVSFVRMPKEVTER